MHTILFVCTGNTCRSPMAEAIARSVLDDSEIFVASAGVAAMDGAPTSEETLRALEAIGIEYEGRSTPLSADMIRKADLVAVGIRERQRGRLFSDRDGHELVPRVQSPLVRNKRSR